MAATRVHRRRSLALIVAAIVVPLMGCSCGPRAKVTGASNPDAASSPVRDDGDTSATTAKRCADRGLGERTYYLDADGDGSGVPGAGSVLGCRGELPAGFASDARDCDDGDATRQRVRYRDRDGDGYGGEVSACVGMDAAGYVDREGDCDDDDAKRFPGQFEIWQDGVDQDCDGDDGLTGCIAAPGVPEERYASRPAHPFPDLSAVVIERIEACDGPDLYLALVGACAVCGGGRSTVVVANRGTQPAAFRIESNAETITVAAPLAPQALAAPIEIELHSPGSTIRVVPEGSQADCDDGNNQRDVQVGHTDC